MDRTILAFISAPMIIPISYAFLNFASTNGRTFDIGGAFVISIICYVWAFLIGIPTYKLATKKSWSAWWQFVLIGRLIGMPFGLLWFPFGISMMLLMAPVAATSSAICALAFWFLKKKRTHIK